MPRFHKFKEINETDWLLVPPLGKGRSLREEEAIRQWVIDELVTTLNFPKSWVGTRIKLSKVMTDGDKLNETLGLSVNLENQNPFILIRISRPGNIQIAEELLRKELIANATAGLGIATDGTEKGTFYLRRKFDSDKCEYLSDIESYKEISFLPGMQPLVLFKEPNKDREVQGLEPLSYRMENIFFELHSHMRDIDGLHADEALDELCKLLYVKIFDEEDSSETRSPRLQRQLYGTSEEFAAATRARYIEANEYDVRVFRLKIPNYERSRGVFNKTIRLSSPALARVTETLQRYSLTESDTDIKGRAFQKVFIPAARSGMGQYFTPHPLINLMVKTMKPKVTDLVLDPFCGSAHFLSKSLEYVRNNVTQARGKLLHEFAFGKLHGIEKSDRMVRVAMTDMRLQGDGHSNIRCIDSLLDFSNYPDLEPESFDLVLTNPPFGSLLGSEAISQLGHFELSKGRKRVPLEILGLERCLQFLRPGGRLGIVVPDSILSNRNSRYVRDWLAKIARLRAIVSFPIETFSPFGANIKTSVLFLRKLEPGEIRQSNDLVCMIRVDNVGYDATGKARRQDDIAKAEATLNSFFDEEGW